MGLEHSCSICNITHDTGYFAYLIIGESKLIAQQHDFDSSLYEYMVEGAPVKLFLCSKCEGELKAEKLAKRSKNKYNYLVLSIILATLSVLFYFSHFRDSQIEESYVILILIAISSSFYYTYTSFLSDSTKMPLNAYEEGLGELLKEACAVHSGIAQVIEKGYIVNGKKKGLWEINGEQREF